MSNNTTGGPDFVKKLFKMLEDESYNDIVAWGAGGDSFVVKEIDAFTKTILPRHFKHSNFASFVRQLNKYDFHKIRNSDDVNTPYGEQAWEFRHPKFQCNKRDQLDNIKRKTPAGRKTATNPPSNNEPLVNSHLSDLQSQVAKLQSDMNNHLNTLSKNYQTVIRDMLSFQKSFVAQDQLMQNLVQYLVNQEAEKHRSSTGFVTNNSIPFIPSEQAQKLINSYTEVSRASLEQMNEISLRAQQSFSQLISSESAEPLSSQSSTTPNPPITPPPDRTLDLGGQSINNPSEVSIHQKTRPNRNSIPSSTNSTAMTSNPTSNSTSPPSPNRKVPDTYPQNATNLGLNTLLPDNNGLTVFTVGHLTPRQTQIAQNNNPTQLANDSPQIPHAENALTQRGSSTMRIHRSTFVPTWSMPPKVLLVEDDEVYQNIGTKLLQIFGCSIDIAMDGITAVNKMNLAKYDLVLMDIVLPNLDGVEATTQIRRFDPTTPIISMTSNTTKMDCIKYITHGMNDVLAKPFTRNKLLSMLERYCTHLRVLPNFQEIPRPLGTPDGSLVPSNQLTASTVPNMSNSANNVRDSWIPSQISTIIPNEFTYTTSANQLDIIGGDEYVNMVHFMEMPAPRQPTGTVRFADDLYGNTGDQQDCRESKRAKFEALD